MSRRAPARHALLACALALAACHGRAAEPREPAGPAGNAAPGPASAAPGPARAAPGPASATPGPASAAPARLVVAVAELAGDPGHRVKERVLAHLRALGPGLATAPTPGLQPGGPSGLAIEVLDVPQPVLATAADGATASDDAPLALLQQGHDRARALLAELGASVLIWGTAGAAPVLYVTTAESAIPCGDPPADATGSGHALCALDTGATWLLCATAWAALVPVGCAPAP